MEITQTELLKKISSFLNKYKIPYMITGAWSTIDFVVELHKKDLNRIVNVFNKLPEDFLVQEDSIVEAVDKKSMFQMLHLPTMLKFDFWLLTTVDFDKSRFLRRKKVKVLDQVMVMASAEDTIIQKLRWYKDGKIEKHLIDAAFVYQIQNKNLDKKYLKTWVNKLKLLVYYEELTKIDLEEYL